MIKKLNLLHYALVGILLAIASSTTLGPQIPSVVCTPISFHDPKSGLLNLHTQFMLLDIGESLFINECKANGGLSSTVELNIGLSTDTRGMFSTYDILAKFKPNANEVIVYTPNGPILYNNHLPNGNYVTTPQDGSYFNPNTKTIETVVGNSTLYFWQLPAHPEYYVLNKMVTRAGSANSPLIDTVLLNRSLSNGALLSVVSKRGRIVFARNTNDLTITHYLSDTSSVPLNVLRVVRNPSTKLAIRLEEPGPAANSWIAKTGFTYLSNGLLYKISDLTTNINIYADRHPSGKVKEFRIINQGNPTVPSQSVYFSSSGANNVKIWSKYTPESKALSLNFDLEGRVLSTYVGSQIISSKEYTATGNLASYADHVENITLDFGYSVQDNLASIVRRNDGRSMYQVLQFDPKGLPLSVAEYANPTSKSYAYNSFGEMTLMSGNGEVVTNAIASTSNSYTSAVTSDLSNSSSISVYDGKGRLVSLSNIVNGDSSASSVSTFSYDSNNFLNHSTSSVGGSVVSIYNASYNNLGCPNSVSTSDSISGDSYSVNTFCNPGNGSPVSIIDSEGNKQTYTYETDGQTPKMVSSSNVTGDGWESVHTVKVKRK